MSENPHRQSKLNTLILSALCGLISIFIVLLGFLGKSALDDIKANGILLVRVSTVQESVLSRVAALESKWADMVTQSELRAQLSTRDQAIADQVREILELKKQVELLNRRTATHPPGVKTP